MKILTDTNLLYDDDEHELCFIKFSMLDGWQIAFIQCLDVGKNHDKALPKRYFAHWDERANRIDVVRAILENGESWDHLCDG